jgi:energy-coupling factor transporter ATP-binding protein EcfA2
MIPSTSDELLDALTASGLDEAEQQILLGYLHDPVGGMPRDPLLSEGPLYLTRVTAEGFRGVGPRASLTLQPVNGLTIVVGANGSGKSSFAEAIERVIDGRILRLTGAHADATEDWRNLHQPTPTRVEVELIGLRSAAPITLGVRWAPDDPPAGGSAYQRRAGSSTAAWDPAGWSAERNASPPILPSAALEQIMASRQSQLFDLFHPLLGLEREDEIDRQLLVEQNETDGRIEAEKAARDAAIAAIVQSGIQELADLTDVLAQPDQPPFVLRDRLVSLAPGTAADVADVVPYARLNEVPELPLTDALQRLQISREAAEAHGAEANQRAERIANLLSAALQHHQPGTSEHCPVCGQESLDDAWRIRAEAGLASHRTASRALNEARSAIAECLVDLRSLIPSAGLRPTVRIPDSVALVALVGRARDGLESGASTGDLTEVFAALRGQVTECRQAATGVLAELASRRQPVDEAVEAWEAVWDGAVDARVQRRRLARVRSWLRGQRQEFRNERLAAISELALATWSDLRQTSSVTLGSLELAGSGNRRKLELVCEIEGVPARARSVLSRGELHGVALSLFVPRALHRASPFGFLVIDDPVQALDRLKVEGLAQVLSRIANERQVLVFTHDERLPEAVDRLGLKADVVHIDRGEGSTVEVSPHTDPIKKALSEAGALIADEKIPSSLAARAVAGSCRIAVEEAAARRYRRQALAKGQTVESIDQDLARASFWDRVGLGLSGKAGSGVRQQVQNRHGSEAAQLLGVLNNSGHDVIWLPERLLSETRTVLRQLFTVQT